MVSPNKFTIVEWLWRTGHRPALPTTVGVCRVNSFLTGGGARKADADLWSKRKRVRKLKKEELELDEAKYEVQYTVGSRVGDSDQE